MKNKYMPHGKWHYTFSAWPVIAFGYYTQYFQYDKYNTQHFRSWYFLCFKPFNLNYEKNINWYRTKGFDHCRKKIGQVDSFIMTREIMAKKVHLNMMCVSDKPLDKLFHDKNTNYYRIYCVPCYNRHRCLDYILKESRLRYFHKRIDYQYFSRMYPGQMQYF